MATWVVGLSFIHLQVDLSCGLDNELLTVTELEKCEYLITGTTPALCTPLQAVGNVRDEL